MNPALSALLIVIAVMVLLDRAHAVYHWFRNRRKSREFYAKMYSLGPTPTEPEGQQRMIPVPDLDALKDLEALSESLTASAKSLTEMLARNEHHGPGPMTHDIQVLAAMVTQLGRITQLQTQVLRSIA